MPLTRCLFPSASYYCGWIYPLLLQWKPQCSSAVFLHKFSTSLCDDQMSKIFDKTLNYTGRVLQRGGTRRLLKVPSNLNYCVILGSSVLYHPCSDQHGDNTMFLVGGLESWFRADQNSCGSLRVGNRSPEPVRLAKNGVEKSTGKKLKQAGREGRAVKGCRVSTRPPSMFSFETKSWYFHPPKGTCCSKFFPLRFGQKSALSQRSFASQRPQFSEVFLRVT